MTEILQIGSKFNCFLVSNESGSILVDTGMESARERIYSRIKNKKVKLIVLTHGHMDHIANAAYLKEKLDVPIAMHEADVLIAKDNANKKVKADSFLGHILRIFSNGMAKRKKPEPFVPDLFLKQGDTLSEFGFDAVVHELPGHTAGSIGLLVDGEKFLVGDAVMNFIVPTASLVFEDCEQMLKSAEYIETTPAQVLYVGHGEPIRIKKKEKKS